MAKLKQLTTTFSTKQATHSRTTHPPPGSSRRHNDARRIVIIILSPIKQEEDEAMKMYLSFCHSMSGRRTDRQADR